MYFQNYELQIRYIESPAREDLLKGNMVNEPKHCWNVNSSIFTSFMIAVKVMELKKFSFNDMQNLKTVL